MYFSVAWDKVVRTFGTQMQFVQENVLRSPKKDLTETKIQNTKLRMWKGYKYYDSIGQEPWNYETDEILAENWRIF